MLNPVGERDIAEEETLLENHGFLVEKQGLALSHVVPFLDSEIAQEFVEAFAAGGLFGSFDLLDEHFFLGSDSGLSGGKDFTFPGNGNFHPCLHNIERQERRTSGDKHGQENPDD